MLGISKNWKIMETLNGLFEPWVGEEEKKDVFDFALRLDSKIPLIGFLREHSWPLGDVPLDVIVGESIVASTIHRAIEFHTPHLIGTIFLTYEANKLKEGQKKVKETILEATKNILSCVDAKEKIIINDKNSMESQVPDMGGKSSHETDRKVESFLRFRLRCFLDAYKGYHQMEITEGDEDKTTFFTGKGVNLKKCSFGVEEGPFLGHLITKQGIKANLLKVKAITNLTLPRTLKEINGLNGKLAALSRFLSKGLDKSLPLFKALKSCMEKKTIQWTADAEEAFQKMNEFIETLQTLTAPIKGEALAIELGEHDIKFKGHNSVKGKELANFLAEMPSAEGKDTEIKKLEETNKEPKFEFETTNNEAEYEALLAGLRIAADMKIKDSSIFVDSQLVSNQVKGLFKARQSVIKQYPAKAKEFLESFNSYSMEHVRRDQNKKDDSLRKLALMTFSRLSKEILVEVLHEKFIILKCRILDIITQ
ncbi:reverse transcriptase domain-containing protein [Tanacetum coccineum]